MGIFTGDGRVGRLNYFAINLALSIIWLVAVLTLAQPDPETGAATGLPVLLLLFPIILWLSITNMIRRLHDRGLRGRMALWSLVPIVGFAFALYLLFAPGEDEPNQYGPPPGGIGPEQVAAKRAELEELQQRVQARQQEADQSYLRDDGTFDTDWLTTSVPGIGTTPTDRGDDTA